jgi:hypothetical protein
MTQLPACFGPPIGSKENSGRISSRGDSAVQPGGNAGLLFNVDVSGGAAEIALPDKDTM